MKILFIILLLNSAQVFAVEWDSLSKQQQQFLQHTADDWAQMPEDRQAKLLERANNYYAMSPEEQARFDERRRQKLEKWQNMSDEDKIKVEQRHKKYQSLTPEKKARFTKIRQYMDSLPDTERQAIKLQMRDADPEQRKLLRRDLAQKAGVSVKPLQPADTQ